MHFGLVNIDNDCNFDYYFLGNDFNSIKYLSQIENGARPFNWLGSQQFRYIFIYG